MTNLKRILTLSVGLLCLVTAVAWASLGGITKRQPTPNAPKLTVQVAVAEVRATPQVLEAVGKVLPSASVEVRAQVGGLLKSVLIKDGDRITLGQPLFAIDAEPLKAVLAQAEAQWARDKALADIALDTETRLRPLAEKKVTTAKEFSSAVNLRISLQAAAEASHTQIDQARILLDYADIRSPIAGRAGAVLVKPGNLLITGGTSPLLVINTISPSELVFAVPQQALASLRAARAEGTLKVEARDNRTQQLRATGELAFNDNAFNDASGTINVKARFENDDEALWPGEAVAIRVILRIEPAAVSIPEQALQQGQSGSYVYLVVDGKARLQTLKVARILDGRAVVTEGLTGGEFVVLSIPSNLRDGTAVDVKVSEPSAAIPVVSR